MQQVRPLGDRRSKPPGRCQPAPVSKIFASSRNSKKGKRKEWEAALSDGQADGWQHPIQGARVQQWEVQLVRQHGTDWQNKLKSSPLTYLQQLLFVRAVMVQEGFPEDSVIAKFKTSDQKLLNSMSMLVLSCGTYFELQLWLLLHFISKAFCFLKSLSTWPIPATSAITILRAPRT